MNSLSLSLSHTHTHTHTFLKASVRICVEMGDHFQRGLRRLPSTFGLSRTEFKALSAVLGSVEREREREREREITNLSQSINTT